MSNTTITPETVRANIPDRPRLTPGPYLFSFRDYLQWCHKAPSWFGNAGYRSEDVICLDQKGRICRIGLHFMAARDEGAFPIDCYVIRDDKELHERAKQRSERYVNKLFGN